MAAQYQCDKHVVKMVLETAQLLSTTHHVLETENLPDFIYRKTHANHPCAIWARSSIANYKWLTTHGLALCAEYTHRYNKVHKSQTLIEWASANIPNIQTVNFSNPPQAMPEIYKNDNYIKAYRSYYIKYKMEMIKCIWTKRPRPFWTMPFEVQRFEFDRL